MQQRRRLDLVFKWHAERTGRSNLLCAGDRIRPLGCGDKLLSDYLTDQKIDRPCGTAWPWWPWATGGVLWACGLGISGAKTYAEADVCPGDPNASRVQRAGHDKNNG